MKAILVIDMPNNCEECKIIYLQGHGESICDSVDWSKRPSWCPLRPLPQKRKTSVDTDLFEQGVNYGWNACLDEILGETE